MRKSNFLHISPKTAVFDILLDIYRQLRENKHILTVVFHHRKTVSEHHSAWFAPLPQAGCFLKNQRNNPPKHRQPLKEQKWFAQIKKLIDLVEESGIAEIEVTEGEEKVRITRTIAAAPVYAAPVPAAA